MNPLREFELSMTRRQLFGKASIGVGTAALHRLLAGAGVFGLSNLVDAQGNQSFQIPAKSWRSSLGTDGEASPGPTRTAVAVSGSDRAGRPGWTMAACIWEATGP